MITQTALLSAAAGGALIGLGASVLYGFNGRTAGVSGIVAGLVRPRAGDWAWRAAFVLGLCVAGTLWLAGTPIPQPTQPTRESLPPAELLLLVPAGLLAGFGARLGGGCTSGHGVCGISRLSPRSIVATLTFIGTGAVAVFMARLFRSGS